MSTQENKKRTYAAVVLDKSGSMNSVKLATVSTYNEQVEQLQINAQEGEDIRVSLFTFNSNVYEHLWNVPAAELQLASLEGYQPAGGTNIWDAMGHVIDRWQAETDTNDSDNYYVMYVISDGAHEEAHPKRTVKQLNAQTTALQKTGRWTFSLMGHDKNYLEHVAQQVGIPTSNAGVWATYSNTAASATAGVQMRAATKKYFAARKMGGANLAANFYNDDDSVADFAAEYAMNNTPNGSVVLPTPGTPVNENILNDGHRSLSGGTLNDINQIVSVACVGTPVSHNLGAFGNSNLLQAHSSLVGTVSGTPVEDLSKYKLGTANVFGNARKA